MATYIALLMSYCVGAKENVYARGVISSHIVMR